MTASQGLAKILPEISNHSKELCIQVNKQYIGNMLNNKMIHKAIKGDVLPVIHPLALHPFCGREAELLGTQELPHPLNSGHTARRQRVGSQDVRDGCD